MVQGGSGPASSSAIFTLSARSCASESLDVGTARLFANLGFHGLATTCAGLAFSLVRQRIASS
jgi:2-methylisocitrate lyase-like PEP mutase family enzyme